MMTRRRFIGTSAGAAAAVALAGPLRAQAPAFAQPRIPRWRGFNIQSGGYLERRISYRESDFAWMAGWGFNFARLPVSYWSWSDPKDWMRIDETELVHLDQGIEMAQSHGIYLTSSRSKRLKPLWPGFPSEPAARAAGSSVGFAVRRPG